VKRERGAYRYDLRVVRNHPPAQPKGPLGPPAPRTLTAGFLEAVQVQGNLVSLSEFSSTGAYVKPQMGKLCRAPSAHEGWTCATPLLANISACSSFVATGHEPNANHRVSRCTQPTSSCCYKSINILSLAALPLFSIPLLSSLTFRDALKHILAVNMHRHVTGPFNAGQASMTATSISIRLLVVSTCHRTTLLRV
jgi:hypothetical protein